MRPGFDWPTPPEGTSDRPSIRSPVSGLTPELVQKMLPHLTCSPQTIQALSVRHVCCLPAGPHTNALAVGPARQSQASSSCQNNGARSCSFAWRAGLSLTMPSSSDRVPGLLYPHQRQNAGPIGPSFVNTSGGCQHACLPYARIRFPSAHTFPMRSWSTSVRHGHTFQRLGARWVLRRREEGESVRPKGAPRASVAASMCIRPLFPFVSISSLVNLSVFLCCNRCFSGHCRSLVAVRSIASGPKYITLASLYK